MEKNEKVPPDLSDDMDGERQPDLFYQVIYCGKSRSPIIGDGGDVLPDDQPHGKKRHIVGNFLL